MQHLKLEELARLVDEEATPSEAAHLAICRQCSDELEDLEIQTRGLQELPDRAVPERQWAVLRSRMAAEGLLSAAPTRKPLGSARFLRIAAALALFAAGGLSGALLRGGPVPPMASGSPAPAGAGVTRASQTQSEAGEQLREAEQLYLAALTRYAELTEGGEEVDPFNRLAALEGIVLTAQAALRDAPADPVINGYLLTAMGQRDAMLRQISRTSDQDWF